MFSSLSDRWKLVLQLFFVLILGAGVVLLVISLEAKKPSANSQHIEFRVEATEGGVAIITLDAGHDSITKPTTVSVPWTKSLRIASGTEVYLTASNPTHTGKLTCTIRLANAPWKTNSTTSPKDGVACAGIVP